MENDTTEVWFRRNILSKSRRELQEEKKSEGMRTYSTCPKKKINMHFQSDSHTQLVPKTFKSVKRIGW